MRGFGQQLLVIVAAGLAAMPPLVAFLDAWQQPRAAWDGAGLQRTTWVVATGVGAVVCGLGLIVAALYFVAIRPALLRAAPRT